MQQNFHVFSGIVATLACLVLPVFADEGEPEQDAIRALIISGGASHDFSLQSPLVRDGLEARVAFPIEWTLRHDDRGRSDKSHPAFDEAGWANDYDIVIHYHCYTRVNDDRLVEKILTPHRAGTPALIIHSALRSFYSPEAKWAAFCGVRTKSHQPEARVTVSPISSDHAIPNGLGKWISPDEELYQIEKVYPGVEIHADGLSAHLGESHPVFWSHEYGPGKTRVVATSLGNSAESIRQSGLLDSLARGFIWALNRDLSEDFVSISREDFPKKPEEERLADILSPGFSSLRQATSKAMSEDVINGNLAGNAIDGRAGTFWQSEQAGPNVLNLWTDEPIGVSAVAVEWLERQPPAYTLEGSLDREEWSLLAAGGDEEGSDTHSLYHFPSRKVRALRLSIPSTRPGERPGVREISAYRDKSEIPAAFIIRAGLSDGLRVPAKEPHLSGLRLRPEWSVGRFISNLPSSGDPIQYVECSDGSSFLLVQNPGKRRQVLHVCSEGKSTVFLDRLEPGSSITWDGEWLYVLAGYRLAKFRDTNRDHIADERHRLNTVFTPDVGTVNFSRINLAIDGWIYATLHSATPSIGIDSSNRPLNLPTNGIVRFKRDGSNIQPFVSASSEVVYFETAGSLSFRAATAAGRERLRGRKLQYGVFPGRDLKSFPLLTSEEEIYLSRGDFIIPATEAGTFAPIAQLDGLQAVFQTSRGLLAFFEDEGTNRGVELLSDRIESELTPELDTLGDLELFPLLSSSFPQIQREAVFEILRRKRDLSLEIEALLQDRNSPSYLPSLALLSQIEGKRAFSLLADAARLSHSAAAFRLLGDRSEAENHPVLGEITRSTDPVTTTEILAAIARSDSLINGLEELVLSFAGVEDERLSKTAVEWLVWKGAAPICFEAIDSPDTTDSIKKAAFQILSKLHRATVAEGLVFRLERTDDPEFRRAALEALCQLYFNDGEVWSSTMLIDSFLRASLTDRRVDTAWLLDRMLEWSIPIQDLEELALASKTQLALQPAAVELMLEQQVIPDTAQDWLIAMLREDSHDPNLRAKALALLNEELELDFALRESGELLASQLIPDARRILLASWTKRLKDRGTESLREDPLKRKTGASVLSSFLHQEVEETSSGFSSADDPYESGFEAFQRFQCYRCHNIHGEGSRIGPDLVLWMQEKSLSDFVKAVGDTDHEIQPGYESSSFELRNGTVFKGLVKAVEQDHFLIADAAGNLLQIPKNKIASRKPAGQSLMPPRLLEHISEAEIENMAHFLRQIGSLQSVSND